MGAGPGAGTGRANAGDSFEFASHLHLIIDEK